MMAMNVSDKRRLSIRLQRAGGSSIMWIVEVGIAFFDVLFCLADRF
jgi:hypothetical protein